MAICQVMIADFINPHNEGGYSDGDLENGIAYCEWLLADGLKRCPLNKYDLKRFIRWAARKRKALDKSQAA